MSCRYIPRRVTEAAPLDNQSHQGVLPCKRVYVNLDKDDQEPQTHHQDDDELQILEEEVTDECTTDEDDTKISAASSKTQLYK